MGEFSEDVASKLRNHKVGNVVSLLSVFAGLAFWPALIAGVGGLIFTSKMASYSVAEVSGNKVTIQHNKWKKKK